MSDKPLKLRISIPPISGVEDVPVAAVEVLARKMGFEPSRVQDIVQALTEACVNAIIYSDSDEMDVDITFIAMHNSLILEVRDRGPGFNPDSVPAPDFDLISEIGVKNGGFGIHMIKSLVDRVEIESSDQGTLIRMSTFLSSPDSSSLTPQT
ncbi:ATP-binding protein [Pseudanabaena sp. PCC 6802]|uniref:ATP-binding protein n=1 Tax=Pseudanabaena sp. PCC 6802 TaxID=118173 RepID=UPI00034CDC3B|nr:ATP-binding protein [Pseudanabaena sp. PCC 6802]